MGEDKKVKSSKAKFKGEALTWWSFMKHINTYKIETRV
jgi:hypothetical protein